MKPLIFALLLFIVFFLELSCGTPPQRSAPAQPPPQDGIQIFRTKCVLCHGADGTLGVNGAKNLQLSTYSLEERKLIILQGKGVMTGFQDQLTPAEIHAVAEYTMTLGAGSRK